MKGRSKDRGGKKQDLTFEEEGPLLSEGGLKQMSSVSHSCHLLSPGPTSLAFRTLEAALAGELEAIPTVQCHRHPPAAEDITKDLTLPAEILCP